MLDRKAHPVVAIEMIEGFTHIGLALLPPEKLAHLWRVEGAACGSGVYRRL